MRYAKHTRILIGAVHVAVASNALAQANVPIATVPSPTVKSTQTFSAILGLTHLPNGEVLVNDAGRRQVVKLSSTLSSPHVVIDSTPGTSNSYGMRPTPLIKYLGDSSLFVDNTSGSLLLIDPNGKISRAMSAPNPNDLRFIGAGSAYVDARGRMVYRGSVVSRAMPTSGASGPPQPPDSMPLLRANFDTRVVDTVGRVKVGNGTRASMEVDEDGKMRVRMLVNPLNSIDDWAVLSDGSIAFVRGQDYHVDVLRPDGEMVRGKKLPFDWKRLTDDDKKRIMDSVRVAMANAPRPAGTFGTVPVTASSSGGGGGGAGTISFGVRAGGSVEMPAGGGIPQAAAPPKIEFVPLKDMPDYLPAIRAGAARPDLDGNLWVLPTTSAQSTGGELVYDVVNGKGELTRRVRMPQGRSVVGFGVGGVVYLMIGDRASGFYLERSIVPASN